MKIVIVYGVAALARKYHKPVIVVCGINQLQRQDLDKLAIETVVSLSDHRTSVDHTIKNAGTLIRKKVSDVIQHRGID